MFSRCFVLAASLLLAISVSGPARAGGVAGKSYRLISLWNGGVPSPHCVTFEGESGDDQGTFVAHDWDLEGRWKHLGKLKGQTLFKVRFSTDATYRFQGLREKTGPGESIGLAGFVGKDGFGNSMSMAGYRVDSCDEPAPGP